jgi:hypothetical protein
MAYQPPAPDEDCAERARAERARGFPHPVRFVIGWVLGIGFFLLSGFVLWHGKLLASPIALVLAVLFFPPANDLMYLKFDIDMCRRCKTWGLIIGLALFFLALGPPA